MEQGPKHDVERWPRRALDRIAYQTISSHSLSEVLDSVTHGLTEEMGAALARIWLIHPDSTDCPYRSPDDEDCGPALHLTASSGLSTALDDPYHCLPLDGESLACVARSRQPFLCNDVPHHGDHPELRWIQWSGLQALAAYPLVFRDKVLGVLAMLSERALSPDEFEMLGVFAAQATVAIQNAFLFAEAASARADLERQVEERTADYARKAQEAETRAREMAALNSVAQAMARSLKVDEIVSDVLQTILCVTELDTGIIHLENNGRLQTVAVAGLPSMGAAPAAPPLDSPVGAVLSRGEPVVLAEADGSETRACYASVFGHPIANAASVPIVARGRSLGILSVSSVEPREFTLRDLQMLHAIAQQMGLALDNARLLLAAEERSEMLALAIQETHHRVKNNLQAISSLLEMRMMQPGDLRAGLRRITDQVRAIALVHDFLSQDADLRGVNLRPVLESLVPIAVSSHTRSEQEIKLMIDVEPVVVPSKEATSLALVATELVANAVEHGLAGRPAGAVTVRLRRIDGLLTLEVQDDGGGIPENYDPERDGNLGTELVLRLVRRHLKGSIDFIRQNGTLVRITLPGVQIL